VRKLSASNPRRFQYSASSKISFIDLKGGQSLTDTAAPVGIGTRPFRASHFKALKELTPAAYRKQFAAGAIAETDASPQINERSPSLQRNPRLPKSIA